MTPPLRPAAFFDVDRTLVYPFSMEKMFLPFLIKKRYVRSKDLVRYMKELARTWSDDPKGAVNENKHHLRHKDPDELEALAEECVRTRILPRVSQKSLDLIAQHRADGHLIVLLTGSLLPLARALMRLLDADLVAAARLEVKDGAFSGNLEGARPYGAEKARLARELAESHNIDLAQSYAYGDHHSDVEVLSCVGHPHAVNPDPALRAEAQRRGWPVVSL